MSFRNAMIVLLVAVGFVALVILALYGLLHGLGLEHQLWAVEITIVVITIVAIIAVVILSRLPPPTGTYRELGIDHSSYDEERFP